MKAIGPNFYFELRAAGIALNGVAWGDDGQITFEDKIPQELRDAVLSVYIAHDPRTPAPLIAPHVESNVRILAVFLATFPNCPPEIQALAADTTATPAPDKL